MTTPVATETTSQSWRRAIEDMTPRRRKAIGIGAALVVVLCLLSAGLGYRSGHAYTPDDASPEAGFARSMQIHHAQAVEMALIVREKTKDPSLRALAYDIITTQQQQSGQMYGWLSTWGLSQTSASPPMSWMRGEGSRAVDRIMPAQSMQMPGMATEAQLAALRASTGTRAERLFLQLMIRHHQGGVAMADVLAEKTSVPVVRRLAQAIVQSQQSEIYQMQQLLDASGAGARGPGRG